MTAWREGPGAGGEGGEQGHGYKGVTTKLLITRRPLVSLILSIESYIESTSKASVLVPSAVIVCVPLCAPVIARLNPFGGSPAEYGVSVGDV